MARGARQRTPRVTKRKRPVYRIGDLLPGIASQLGLNEELQAARAMSSWERIVAELVPAATGASRLLEVRPPGLYVTADDAPTGQELRLHTVELLEATARLIDCFYPLREDFL